MFKCTFFLPSVVSDGRESGHQGDGSEWEDHQTKSHVP